MSRSETYTELISSQLPALQLLLAMNWQYLTPQEALVLRGGREKNVVLTDVLDGWLRENNHIDFKGRRYEFSDANIRQAMQTLTSEPFESLLLTNERIYDHLTLGKSFEQTIDGDKKSHSLHYIDWQHPENNVYHITDEFTVERRGSHEKCRPDIVLFINGIPVVVMECKRPDLDKGGAKAHAEAVSQMVRNQRDTYIPHLFTYSQLLLAVSRNDASYATTGTPAKFWAIWKEEADLEAEVQQFINKPLSDTDKARLYDWRDYHWQIRRHFAELEAEGERLPTEQDRTLYAMLRPKRLLELLYQFIVFDGGVKKIARYQQYFAIQATVRRVEHLNAQGQRTGGVIWHTTGSGKSLTMVMLAKALALHPDITNPRVVLVTDRVNLDDQIYKTFAACGKDVVQADSGAHLVRLVTGRLKANEQKGDVITTVIDKFYTAANEKVVADNVNVFVLVDESHRSQYGTIHAKMKQVFPNACYIGFTGTPLTKSEKSTAKRFGDFIHKYTMRQAVEDKAVVPLLYEGRMVEQDVDRDQLEKWFERRTRGLTDEQVADLKRKMSRSDVVNATEQRIKEIAYDVADHYKRNWRNTGFKAQMATASKRIAMKYMKHLEEEGIRCALVISPPDTREGHETVDDSDLPVIQAFWQRLMNQYRNEENYNREILSSFARADGIEILVVVDKLLTGFDEPRNRVLYIDKGLKEHGLLQAIARVNRLFEGKDFGYIIDYRGVLGELNEALDIYNALEEYDVEDVVGTFTDVSEQIRLLPQLHSDLWAIFQAVSNKVDNEALERFLEPEDRRQHFYEALTDYARALQVALATIEFYHTVSEQQIRQYKDDLTFFHNLLQSVKMRYAEAIDYRDYEEKIRKLLDEHVKATGVNPITELVNIFNQAEFNAEVERLISPVAKADTILNRMKRTVTERMEEDPAFYRRFADMIEDTILAYKEGRLSELDYLNLAAQALDELRSGQGSGLPSQLSRYFHAPAYYGVLQPILDGGQLSDSTIADIAIQIEALIEQRKIRDWASNRDVQNQIRRELDNYLFELEKQQGVVLTGDQLDTMIDTLMDVAIARDKLA
jgi:type I restriction enzyme, R subunit